ncbi:unnamed protein product [Cylicocyclus nassatus]|uniref:Uncharacterized protein n=1 Tax=Cylicocyclus nassatus TaxID=53992 RepID=A0AA36DI90_CYLNA|nr:unnamed protein product [Cylicocyclus nassatus]
MKRIARELQNFSPNLRTGQTQQTDDASGDEDVTMDDTEQSLLDDEINQADKDADGADAADIPAPFKNANGYLKNAAREALSLFSDKRTQLYEEEIKLARLK